VIKDVDSPISFSPDGQHFVFLRELHNAPTWDLLLAKSDGTIEKPSSAVVLCQAIATCRPGRRMEKPS